VACMRQGSGAVWVAVGSFQATCGGQRNARGGPGAIQSGGRRGDAPAALNRGVGLRWKKKDPFAISKNSKDLNVNKQ